MSAYRPTICVDFDGVVHSYESGWKGVDIIPDPPVSGAFQWLESMLKLDHGPLPVIYSSRSKDPAGVSAMRYWFMLHGFDEDLLDLLAFPTQKPAAFLTIDDRAWRFDGYFPTSQQMMDFKPWYRQ